MAIPELNSEGFLPPGIHDCSMEEVRNEFGTFRRTDRRVQLMKKLEAYLTEIHSTSFVEFVLLDGSFVTASDEPNDIDLVLVLPAGHDYSATIRPFEYNVLSRRQVQKRYGFDVLIAESGRPKLDEYIEFFSQIRGLSGLKKGLLRVRP